MVICNDATSDSRFQSWQYREMQDETNEPLVPSPSPSNAQRRIPLLSPPPLPWQGTIIGVALLDAEERCKHVFECYRPEPAATGVGSPGPPCLDGADAFLLQTLGDYAGAAAVAIRQRWEQIRVAQLPAILLASDSFAGFISRLREFLKEWFSVLDGAHAPRSVTPARDALLMPSLSDRSRARMSDVARQSKYSCMTTRTLPACCGFTKTARLPPTWIRRRARAL